MIHMVLETEYVVAGKSLKLINNNTTKNIKKLFS
jgi:hypothetical protein